MQKEQSLRTKKRKQEKKLKVNRMCIYIHIIFFLSDEHFELKGPESAWTCKTSLLHLPGVTSNIRPINHKHPVNGG